MLAELTVKGLGIIDEITWKPAFGLNVVTGETGAGKSLVVDAIETLLTGQVSAADIRHGSEGARVEGVFNIGDGQRVAPLRELLAEKGLEDDGNLVLSSESRPKGRTTLRVNRQAVPRGLFTAIGSYLVDIHGQSEHLSLLNRQRQLDFLDSYAHSWEVRRRFAAAVSKLSRMEQELETLARDEKEFTRHMEFLRFQVDEIDKAKLQEGEETELEKERIILEASEKLKATSSEVYDAIAGDENTNASPALDGLNQASLSLKQIVEKDASFEPQFDYLKDTIYRLEELARDLRIYGESLEANPHRLEEIEARLQLIRDLKRKYGESVSEMLRLKEKLEAELNGLTNSNERRSQLESEIEQLRKTMGEMAAELSQARSLATTRLADGVKNELADLNMGQMDFKVSLLQESAPEGIPLPDGDLVAFNATGADTVEFQVATNPGEPLKPLAKVASTGEISRFLLALKVVLAEADVIPVLIFDEIDIGIGGRSGQIIGQKLWNLSQNHQVICITHLPQIAAFADVHCHVQKAIVDARAVSQIKTLNDDALLGELASMLAGPNYTPASLKTAQELLEAAQQWKNAS